MITSPGWAEMTFWQWDQFTLAQWDAFTLNSTAQLAGSNSVTYDATGDRMTRMDAVTSDVTTYVYDNANRLVTAEDVSGTTTYTYDASGNQTTIEEPNGDLTTNTWDGENRLVQVEHPSTDITTYAYNGDGLRVEKDDGTVVTRYVHDGNNVLQETDDVGVVEAEFTYVPQPYAEVISQHRNMDSSFYQFDGINNVRQLTDDTQVVTDEYAFDAWGDLRSSTGSTANSQYYGGKYLAYQRDPDAGPETEYSLHYRNYNPKTGVFKSEDPAEDDLNLYRYVKNNPVNKEDPSGLAEWEIKATSQGTINYWLDGEIIASRSLRAYGVYDRSRPWADQQIGVEYDFVYRLISGPSGQGRVYRVPQRFFQQFLSQPTADELTSWTDEQWNNWFRAHDIIINPQATVRNAEPDESGTQASEPPPLRAASPAFSQGSAAEQEVFSGYQIPEPNTGEDFHGGLQPTASDQSMTQVQAAGLVGLHILLLGAEIGKELASQYAGGRVLAVAGKAGSLVVKVGGKSVKYSRQALKKILKKLGRNVDDIDTKQLAKEINGRHTDDLIKHRPKLKPDANWRSTNKLNDFGPNPTSAQKSAANTANATKLRKNLGDAISSQQQAHHIVPSTHPKAKAARKLLDKYQIDINDAANGVGRTFEEHHRTGLHRGPNIRAVTDRLEAAVRGVKDWATARLELLDELAKIKAEIVNGSFP